MPPTPALEGLTPRRWLPLAVGLAGVALTIVVWLAMGVVERDGIERAATVRAKEVAARIRQDLDLRIRSLVRMAARWAERDGIPEKEWMADARGHYADQPGYQAIEWVDAQFRVRWIVPLEGNEQAQDLDLAFEERRRHALEAARDRRAVTITRAIDLVQGGKGFLVYAPIFREDQFQGFILGVFRVQAWLDHLLGNTGKSLYTITLHDGSDEFYRRAANGEESEPAWAGEALVAYRGSHWQVRLLPSSALVAASRSDLRTAALAFGLLLATMAGIALHFRQVAIYRAGVESVNERLRAEIGERQRVGEALADSEAQVRLLLDSTAEAIYGLDLDGNCTLANPACARMLGYGHPDDLVGRNMHELIHHTRADGDPCPANHCRILKALRQGEETHADGELLWRADGSSFPAEYWSYPIRRDGLAIGGVVTFLDITERQRNRELILRKNRELESLLYVASHDLREPLRSIENFSRLVHDRYAEQLDEKGRDFTARVVRAAMRMNQLLDDLLALSRVHRMEPPTEGVDTGAVVQDELAILAPRIEETGAHIQVSPNLPSLRVNRLWVGRTISNLVHNALKFTCDGEAPEIEIAPYQVKGGAGILVRDRGPGVEPEHADRIFQLFQRAVGREVEGTGAGLAIVRQVAEHHGGHAWVQPREGGGAEFVVTFGSRVAP